MIWINSDKITDSWQPEIYSDEFEILSEWMSTRNENSYITVSKYFSVVNRNKFSVNSPADIRWMIKQERNSISIVYQPGSIDGRKYCLLPDEAMIIGQYIDREVPIFYWNSRIAGGNAVIENNLIAIEPIQQDLLAWVAFALKSGVCQQQLKKSTIGTVIDRMKVSSIMNLEVPEMSNELKVDRCTMARNDLVLNISKAKSTVAMSKAKRDIKQVLLTGATFEERMTQFEEYLIQQRLFDERKSFFAENISNDNNVVNYIIRPLRGSWSKSQHTHGGNYNDSFVDSVQNRLQDANEVIVQHDARSNSDWLSWINDKNAQYYKVFNVNRETYGMPDNIVTSILRQLYAYRVTFDNEHFAFKVFPAYTSFIDLLDTDDIESFDDIVGGDNNITAYIAALITNKTAKQTLYELYSPTLAIKVVRDNILVGVYIFISDYEADRQQEIESVLIGYGIELSNLISQISEFVSDAARRESLRRLSDVMHKLSGPILRITSALNDIDMFVSSHTDIGQTLLPDEQKAKNRAAMTNESLSEYTVAGRLKHINDAVQDMKKLSYQVKKLKFVHGDISRTAISYHTILVKALDNLKGTLSDLIIETDIPDNIIVLVNEETILSALDEVLSNSIREMIEHKIDTPQLQIKSYVSNDNVYLIIGDNGLPINTHLISNPFEESATTYFRTGRGSGLGLAIVKETFLRHGGNCKLFENIDVNGNRLPGVTFEASLPVHKI